MAYCFAVEVGSLPSNASALGLYSGVFSEGFRSATSVLLSVGLEYPKIRATLR